MSRKILVFLLFTAFYFQTAFSQGPFVLRGEVEAPIFIATFSMLGGTYQAKQQHALKTVDYINSLKPEQVNRFDRSAIRMHSGTADMVSNGLMVTSFVLPFTLLGDKAIRKDFGKIAVMDAEVIALNTTLTNLVKELVQRPRPLVYNPEIPIYKKRGADNFKSFFSGHTSTVSSQSFFFAYVFTTYNPHHKLLPLVWTTAAVLPLATGLMRYSAGKHFWTDVLIGYAVGALVGVGVPALHRTSLWNRR
jgi:membrane-associated phospholipid phosphatase